MPDIILHNFDASPFAEKVRLILGLKGLAWLSVDAELILPKPNLTALTGGYRKTPVMQIGADIYCDSRLIAEVLEKRCPEPTIYPNGSRGLCLALSAWSDTALHICSSGLVIGVNKSAFPESLMADRKKYFNGFMDVEHLDAEIPHLTTQLRAHASLIEQQLLDDRLFWLGEEPSLADFHAYVEIWTARAYLPFAEDVFDDFRLMRKWEERVKAIDHGHKTVINVEEAHSIAFKSQALPGCGIDSDDVLGLSQGDTVIITPDDYGREPVLGRLITLKINEVAIERQHPNTGKVVVHFPRIGYRITKG